MPQLFDMIKTQITSLARILFEDPYGNTKDVVIMGYVVPYKWMSFLINALSAVTYLIILIFFGLFLWNRGLQPVFPNFVEPIGASPYAQVEHEGVQLFLTLLAIFMIV